MLARHASNPELFHTGPAVKLTHGGFNAGSPAISLYKGLGLLIGPTSCKPILFATIVQKKFIFAGSQLALSAMRTTLAMFLTERGTKTIGFLFVPDTIRFVTGWTSNDVAFIIKGKPC